MNGLTEQLADAIISGFNELTHDGYCEPEDMVDMVQNFASHVNTTYDYTSKNYTAEKSKKRPRDSSEDKPDSPNKRKK